MVADPGSWKSIYRTLASLALAAVVTGALPAGEAGAGGPLKPDGRHTSHALEPAHALKAVEPSRPVQIPLGVPDPEQLRREKERAAQAAPPPGVDPFGPSPEKGRSDGERPNASVLSGLNQPGLGPTGSSPPDTTGAVGPSHYLEMVNTSIAVYSKTDLSQVGPTLSLRSFAQLPAGTESAFDPQIIWDPQTSRWYYVLDRLEGPIGSRIAHLRFGWSKTADPTDLANGWCHQDIATGADFDDFPKLGDNDTHIVFGTNVFPTNANPSFFQTARIWTVPKPAAGDTTCPATVAGIQSFGSPLSPLRTADNAIAFTPVPANTMDGSVNAYVVAENRNGGNNEVMAWHVDASGLLVLDGNVPVDAYSVPPDVPQPNVGCAATCDLLDSIDARLTQAVSHKDPDATSAQAVWTQHTIADPAGTGRSVVRWYELLPGNCAGGTCPASARRQQGEVKDSTHHAFNGAIAPTTSGNEAVINYSVGSGTLTAEIRARSRLPGTALGAMGAEVTLGTSAASLDDATCGTRDTRPSCRWGDYAGATPDPGNSHVVWGSNQTIGPVTPGSPHWRTRNFALEANVAPVNAPPTASFTATPSPAQTGQSVSFNGSASADPDGTIARYEWDLDGNGSFETDTGTTPTTSRTYTTPQTLNVKLRVTDNENSTAETTRSLRINAAPTASFTATPNPAQTGQSVSFNGSAEADPDGTIARYEWDLDGNGSFETDTGTTPTTSRTYTTPQTLNVKLRVTDNENSTAETTRSLLINAAPTASNAIPVDPAPVRPPVLKEFPGCAATTTNVIRGTLGKDTLAGTLRGDRIFSDRGEDVVNGVAGDDCVDLAAGTDRGQGGTGSDRVLGGSGGDRLGGGSGSDRLLGGAGGDRISGGSGNDRTTGDAGADRLKGGAGRDIISGGSGNDRISARDRKRDRIRCGKGRDSVIADRLDRVARDCERVRRVK